MDEEEGVPTPSTTSPSTPQSPPMRGTKVRPLNGNNGVSRREGVRPSVFQGDGLEAFIDMYVGGDGARSTEIPNALFPPSPMERYEHWDDDVAWRLSGNMNGDVAGEAREDREGERELRLSYIVEDALKVFSSTKEESAQSSNSKSPATVKGEVNSGKEAISTGETQESLFRDLMAERQKKIFTRGVVHAHVRLRRSAKKDDGALVVEEKGEVARVGKGEKRKGKGSSVVSNGSGYDSSQRLRSLSVSDEEEKGVKMAKLSERCL